MIRTRKATCKRCRPSGKVTAGKLTPMLRSICSAVRRSTNWRSLTSCCLVVDVPVLGKASYTLRYRYAPGDTAISWDSTDAHGAVRDVRGEYLLDEIDPDTTQVFGASFYTQRRSRCLQTILW